MNKQPVVYYQTDKRWAGQSYAVKGESSTVGASGCGPTAMAMVLATWADSSVTPATECAWALKHGFKALGHGTFYAYFEPAARRYGLSCYQLNGASIYGNSGSGFHSQVLAAVKQGDYVIACMGPGNWTRSGHFVVLWDVDVERDIAYVNDPASTLVRRTRGSWKLFKQQVKFYFRVRRPRLVEIPKEEFTMTEQEIAALVEQTVKTKLKDYVRAAIREEAVAQAAQPEPEWSRSEGSWQRAVRAGITDGSRPCAPAARCEVVAMMVRADDVRAQDEANAAEAEPEWSRRDGTWAKARELGFVDSDRPSAPATRCEVAAMILRAETIRQRKAEEARSRAVEMGMD